MVAQADPNDGIKINIPVSTDPKVVGRRIYRTTVNGSTFYYDGEVTDNTTTTYSSTKSDTQISMGTFYTMTITNLQLLLSIFVNDVLG